MMKALLFLLFVAMVVAVEIPAEEEESKPEPKTNLKGHKVDLNTTQTELVLEKLGEATGDRAGIHMATGTLALQCGRVINMGHCVCCSFFGPVLHYCFNPNISPFFFSWIMC